MRASTPSGTLWGMTAYFNFKGSRTRRENYRMFRESSRRQGLRLIAVEAALPGMPFELSADDADILIQRRASAVLWQKERLLNIAAGYLPPDCDKVAWLDCDVVFPNDAWINGIESALEEHAVVQAFSEVRRLERGAAAGDARTDAPSEFEYLGAVHRLATESTAPETLPGAHGLAMAARRSAIDACGFYDRMILGGADTLMLGAFMGMGAGPLAQLPYFPRMLLEDVERWAVRADDAVRGNVGYLPGTAYHLWHGPRARRFYAERQLLLHDFRPDRDIRVDSEECWTWTDEHPALRERVGRYFRVRGDGGEPVERAEEELFEKDLQLAAAQMSIVRLRERLDARERSFAFRCGHVLERLALRMLPLGSGRRRAAASLLRRILPLHADRSPDIPFADLQRRRWFPATAPSAPADERGRSATDASPVGPIFSTDWFTRKIPQWSVHLAHLRGRADARYLEVGAWEGRSMCWMLRNILTHPSARAIAIDLFPATLSGRFAQLANDAGAPASLDLKERFAENIRRVGAEGKVRALRGNSRDVLGTINESFDCVYIDGDHCSHNVLSDAVLSWPLLKEGGIMILDDYGHERFAGTALSPKRGIDAFLSVFEPYATVLERGYQVFVRKDHAELPAWEEEGKLKMEN